MAAVTPIRPASTTPDLIVERILAIAAPQVVPTEQQWQDATAFVEWTFGDAARIACSLGTEHETELSVAS